MCETNVDWPEFFSDGWQCAIKRHRCCSCGESVLPGYRYHVCTGKWEGEFRTYKHCARCWILFKRLQIENDGEVALELDCGEVYEGDDPKILELAFVTPTEAQTFVLK